MTDSGRAEPDQPRPVLYRWWCGLRRWYWMRRRMILLVALVVLFAAVMLAPFALITVPPGHLGVLWLRFFGGTVSGSGLGEGLQPIFPWDRVYIYDGRLQAHSETYDVVSKDGLSLQVEITFRWQPLASNLGGLHRDIGPNYLDVLLIPEIGSVTREVIARYDWPALVSSQRQEIQQNILNDAAGQDPTTGGALKRFLVPFAKLADPSHRLGAFDYIAVKDILIRSVILPPALRYAIERKLEQSQIADEYKYRLQRERLESERKEIEAEGIRLFQQKVQQGISETYLKWRGIEATLELARSPNAKVVVIGGNNGLPIILNTGDDLKPSSVGPAVATPKQDLPPAILPPNRPSETPLRPNVPLSSPLGEPPASSAPAAPLSTPPSGGGANLIDPLSKTLLHTFGWDIPPQR
jgi:regulator of protease activity HflC (stomatin/prohibitin superfamily)